MIGFQIGPWARLVARFEFEPRDLWVGAYWTIRDGNLHVYLGLVPALPLHLVLGVHDGD